jgi:hypothetical protein
VGKAARRKTGVAFSAQELAGLQWTTSGRAQAKQLNAHLIVARICMMAVAVAVAGGGLGL